MRRWTYLNGILTVNAVLLTALVWTQLASTPLFAGRASAQSSIPNAAEQRYEMLRAIRDVQSSVEETVRLLEKRTLRVKVTNFDEIKLEPLPGEQEAPHRFEHGPTDDAIKKKVTRKPVVEFSRPIETVKEAEWRSE